MNVTEQKEKDAKPPRPFDNLKEILEAIITRIDQLSRRDTKINTRRLRKARVKRLGKGWKDE